MPITLAGRLVYVLGGAAFAFWSRDVLTGAIREDGSPLSSAAKWTMIGVGVVGALAIVRQVTR